MGGYCVLTRRVLQVSVMRLPRQAVTPGHCNHTGPFILLPMASQPFRQRTDFHPKLNLLPQAGLWGVQTPEFHWSGSAAWGAGQDRSTRNPCSYLAFSAEASGPLPST